MAPKSKSKRLAVFDTETTGLTLHPDAPAYKQPRCIELAIAILDTGSGEIVEEHEWLFNPQCPLEPVITKITGLTDENLVDKPLFAAEWPHIKSVLASADILAAHNLPFDRAIISGELSRMDMKLWVKDVFWPEAEFCTVAMFQEEFGYAPKLVQLHEMVLGEKYPQTHRAMDDVRALARIIQHERLWEMFE